MKESLQKRLESLKSQREQAIAAVQQILGAIAVTEDIIKELEAPKVETPKS